MESKEELGLPWGNKKVDFTEDQNRFKFKAANTFHEREEIMQELITRLTLLDFAGNTILISKAKRLSDGK